MITAMVALVGICLLMLGIIVFLLCVIKMQDEEAKPIKPIDLYEYERKSE